jgi:hypothetical protein
MDKLEAQLVQLQASVGDVLAAVRSGGNGGGGGWGGAVSPSKLRLPQTLPREAVQ